MKRFCRYAVIDIKTGYLLALGQRWKDFDSGNIRYINSGRYRSFPVFGREISEYFRTLEINGRQCAIVYWAMRKGKRLYNGITLSGRNLCMRGQNVSTLDGYCDGVYRDVLDMLGVRYENA